MRIKKIAVHALQAPVAKPYRSSQGWIKVRSTVIVELECDNGIIGFGECLCHGQQPPQLAAAFIQHCFAPHVIGRDVFDVEVIWEELYNLSRPYGQQGVAVNALSGLDIALWDAIGKELDQPICNLIGGKFRTRVKAYATGFFRREDGRYPEDSVKEAMGYVERGFQGMKLKTGFGADEDIRMVREVRKAIGPDIMLMTDANCAYNLSVARRIVLELEPEKVEFFEELLPPEDIDGYVQLRNLTSAYIAAGENIFGKIAFKEWVKAGALDIYQPDLCSCGGYTECKKIAALAQAWNTMVIPHAWGSGVGLAAALQYIASLAPAPISMHTAEMLLEFDQSSHPFRLDLIQDGVEYRDGYVNVPMSPGIGVEVDRKTIERYQIM